jgi:hypothetical protein
MVHRRAIVFRIFAFLFLAAAAFHFINLFFRINEAPLSRHLLFILINMVCAAGFIKRPKYFIYVFSVLLIQQYYSHGSYLIRLWQEENKIHWISIGVLITMSAGMFLLMQDARSQTNS